MSNILQSKPKKKLSPKLDIVFQALFGEVGSERITTNFLESILQEKINEIDLSKNTILRREYKNDKLGVLDVFARLNGTESCNIEIQVSKDADLIERILYYWARMYTRQIKSGEEYKRLNRAIVILICDYGLEEIKKLEENKVLKGEEGEILKLPYHTEWKIIETETKKIILTNKLEIHIINLEKAREIEEKEKQDELLDWLSFLENPESGRVKEKMEENEVLKEAVEKLETLSDDEEMQRLADYRESIIWREQSVHKAGVIEGKEQGREEGREEGRRETNLKNAKKMLEKNIPIETIIEITGLTKEEILKKE